MAGKNTVTLTFAGDAQSLQKTFDNVASSSKDMATKVDQSSRDLSSGFDKVTDGADGFESKTVGLRDAITGTGDVMKGFKEGDMTLVLTGFADLASSVANFAGPVIKSVLSRLGIMTAATATQTAATGAATGAQTGLNAAMAANPIGLVIAAIVALIAIGVLLWKNWDTVKEVFNNTFGWIKDRFGDLVSFVGGLPGKIAGVARGMFDGIKDAFRGALNFIIDAWNNLSIGFDGFDIPGPGPNIPGFRIDTPNIPRFHSGGVVPGGPNTETLAMLQGGERVVPNGGGAGGGVTIVVQGSVITERDLARVVNDAVRNGALYGVG